MSKSKAILPLFIAVSAVGCGGSSDSGGTKKCADFDTQSEAQAYFNQHNATNLDGDNDGIACEHLPNGLMPNEEVVTDLNQHIGDYVLLGQSCSNDQCTPQVAYFSIVSENELSICLAQNIERICDVQTATTYSVSGFSGKSVFFESGMIQLDPVASGHLSLTLDDAVFSGQNVLMTDYSLPGAYFNGVTKAAPNDYKLKSLSGQEVRWSEQAQLSISNY